MVTSELDPGGTVHIGMVVRNLRSAMEMYWRLLGIGPWMGHSSGTSPYTAVYRGRLSVYRAHVAVARIGDADLELIQPLESDSIYGQFLASRGEGMHHIGFLVPDFDEALLSFRTQGIGILQSMSQVDEKGRGRQAHLDSERQLGAILELVEKSSAPAIHWVYPR